MKYSRDEAKAYSRANMKGIWAAALMPFTRGLALEKETTRHALATCGLKLDQSSVRTSAA